MLKRIYILDKWTKNIYIFFWRYMVRKLDKSARMLCPPHWLHGLWPRVAFFFLFLKILIYVRRIEKKNQIPDLWSQWRVVFICYIDIPLKRACTGCSLNIVFFSKILKYSGLCFSLFSLAVSVCTHTRQVEHQCCSRTGRVQKNHQILRKKHNI